MVARELITDRLIRLWQDELGPEPPFPINDDTLFVAYFASAELGCFLELGWPVPTRILDLYTEFRNATNGLPLPGGRGYLSALSDHGYRVDHQGAEDRGTRPGDGRRTVVAGANAAAFSTTARPTSIRSARCWSACCPVSGPAPTD